MTDRSRRTGVGRAGRAVTARAALRCSDDAQRARRGPALPIRFSHGDLVWDQVAIRLLCIRRDVLRPISGSRRLESMDRRLFNMMLYEIEKRAYALRSGSFTRHGSCLAELNRPQQLIGLHMFLERELIEQRSLYDLPMPQRPRHL